MYIKFYKYFTIITTFILSFGAFTVLGNHYEKVVVQDLSKSVIRFHVLANSDSPADQYLKMKVKNAVVEFLETNMTDAACPEDAANFLKDNTENILTVARKVILDNGYNYEVSASLGTSDFPDKSYGDVTFPAGKYNSYIIKIGSAEGHNWWCVLYPPLCFVDASTGILPDESKQTLKNSISESEYNYVTGCSPQTASPADAESSPESTSDTSDGGIRFEFKYFTFLNHLLD